MNKSKHNNSPSAILNRLREHAKKQGDDMNLLLTRYGAERFLYRLSQSPYADQFLLKGALLFIAWTGHSHRPTKDIDLLGFGDSSSHRLRDIFQQVCAIETNEDGIKFEPTSVHIDPIREAQSYAGQRMRCEGYLDTARIRVKIDVGFGDAVTPEPYKAALNPILDLPPPILRVYPKETVIAEKLEAIIQLGIANSRMKDYYDLWVIFHKFSFDNSTLYAAIQATFKRRGTPIPKHVPIGLSDEFADDKAKQAQWTAFLKKTQLSEANISFSKVVELIRTFVAPVLIDDRGI